MVHVKKCHPDPFHAMAQGHKTFEYRPEDDCKYEIHDELILLEWDPAQSYRWETPTGGKRLAQPNGYTGRILKRLVTYVLRGEFGVPSGYVVLGLKDLPLRSEP